MAAPRCRPSKRTTDVTRNTFADRVDPRNAGPFDKPLARWNRPCPPILVEKPPVGPKWTHEIKWGGYRVSTSVAAGVATIRTRNGHDWSACFPAIAAAVAGLNVRSTVLDGEAVILDERGRSSFAELQADLGARARRGLRNRASNDRRPTSRH